MLSNCCDVTASKNKTVGVIINIDMHVFPIIFFFQWFTINHCCISSHIAGLFLWNSKTVCKSLILTKLEKGGQLSPDRRVFFSHESDQISQRTSRAMSLAVCRPLSPEGSLRK